MNLNVKWVYSNILFILKIHIYLEILYIQGYGFESHPPY